MSKIYFRKPMIIVAIKFNKKLNQDRNYFRSFKLIYTKNHFKKDI